MSEIKRCNLCNKIKYIRKEYKIDNELELRNCIDDMKELKQNEYYEILINGNIEAYEGFRYMNRGAAWADDDALGMAIRSHFLFQYIKLPNSKIIINFPKLKYIGNHFFLECSFKSVKLYAPKLFAVYDDFFSKCSFKSFKLEVPKLTTVGRGWLSKSSLKSFKLYVPNLYSVGNSWLYSCNIESFELNTPELIKVGNSWLSYSSSKSVKIYAPKLAVIGSNFLYKCKNISFELNENNEFKIEDYKKYIWELKEEYVEKFEDEPSYNYIKDFA